MTAPKRPTNGRANVLRRIRLTLKCSQSGFAGHLGVSENTYRVWDSGRRAAPRAVLHRAKRLQETECGRLFPLQQLASEYHVHVRTLRKAARDGRLAATFSSRMTFGNLVAFATQEAVAEFKRRYYRQTTTWNRPSISVVVPVPEDYARRLIHLRARLRLSQQELAVRVGAAGRAIVYQWESERRRPSPVFWKKVESLANSLSARSSDGSNTGLLT